MGVAGLWDIIRPTGKTRSLTHLAVVSGFEENTNGKRGFRVGIDASIWFFHAAYGKEGENPELRTLFFRCSRLMSMPFLPLFVFDGPKRPSVKRGKRIGGNAHWLTEGMKNLIQAFGFEWRTAPGEAEAELAYLNRIGMIDGILSDDVDNFLFGAEIVIRNPSSTLSGNRAHPTKNSAGKDDGQHVVIYNAKDILDSPDIGLTRGGFILIGLLSGGDYHQAGLARCGPNIAHGLAKCGFGDTLLNAAHTLSREDLEDFIIAWRKDLQQELRTNAQGHMGRKSPSLAKSMPDDFPDIDILLSYTNPITSETEARGKKIDVNWDREPDIGKIAGLCELYFEWGVKPIIVKRFRTVLWPSAVLRILRRAALDIDSRTKQASIPSTPRKSSKNHRHAVGTPSKMIAKHFSSMQLNSPSKDVGDSDDDEERLIVKIHSSRNHASTDGVLEYRLEIAPAQLVRMAEAGVTGIRPPIERESEEEEFGEEDDEDGGSKKLKGKKPPPDSDSHLRIWMPACMVRMVEPDLVSEYEGVQQKKLDKKTAKGRAKVTKTTSLAAAEEEESSLSDQKVSPPAVKKAAKKNLRPFVEVESDTDNDTRKDLKTFFPVTKGVKSVAAKVSAVGASASAPLPVAKTKANKPKRKPSAIPTALSDESEIDDNSPVDAPQPSTSRLLSLLTKASQTSDNAVGSRDREASTSDTRTEPKPSLNEQSQPRPFPMSFEDFQSIPQDLDDPFAEVALQPLVQHPPSLQKKSYQASDSDSQDRIKKSPRKNMSHTSPHAKRIAHYHREEEEEDILESRPTSPSPAKARGQSVECPKSTKPLFNHSVVEISSDSDSEAPPPRSTLPPLLLAKVKARSKTEPVVQKPAPFPKGKRKTALSSSDVNAGARKDNDIIDLT